MTSELINLFDYEERAKELLPRGVFDFIDAGAFDEITTRRNRKALDRICLRPRFLMDVSEVDTSTTVLGQKISFPVMLAPSGGHAAAHPDGELATTRGAGAAGTILALSTYVKYNIEETAAAATGPLWFQLYHRGYDLSEMLVRRAEEAGYAAICLTVDTPGPGTKERDLRNEYAAPPDERVGNFLGAKAGLGFEVAGPDVPGRSGPPAPSITWGELGWLRSLTSLPLVLKGIRTAEDARLCVEHGVDGILVSNHGGRQIDGTLSAVETLPEIVEAVGGRAEVYLDGGIRRGADVVRSLALGARAVLIGRPFFWGLAVDGEAGVKRVLDLLRAEFERAMKACGVTNVEEITRRLVALPGEAGWAED